MRMPPSIRLMPLLLPLSLLSAATVQAQPATGFSKAQQQEIVQIVRDALQRDPSILREAIAALQRQDDAQSQQGVRDAIRANRRLLLADPGDQVAGNPDGDITVVEFYDTRCPYCRGMLPVLAQMLTADPKIRLVYKDMPVLGPASLLESRALLAARAQGGYVALQGPLMRSPSQATEATVRAAALAAGLDIARLFTDMREPAIDAHINATLDLARALRIEGTPALVIGDQLLSGAASLPDLQAAIAHARAAS